MTTAAFDKAARFQNIDMFHQCVQAGIDLSSVDHFNRTPLFGLRFCILASLDEFRGILRAFIDAGADIDHMDSLGNTLLLMSEVDNLGVALVELGARISYDLTDSSKKGLANAAIYGCTQTIDAMVSSRLNRPNRILQKDFDSCFDQAAKMISFNPSIQDMSGLVKLVVDYGANPNERSTLHYSVRSNPLLVATLISLGARTDTLAWDFYRGVKNTPVHRITDMASLEVFRALFEQNPECDVDAGDGSGATPLMTLMKTRSPLHVDDNVVMTRVAWLMAHRASCLPVDNAGIRVCAMPRCKRAPFKQIISARIKEENWLKRRGMVMRRHRLCRCACMKRNKNNQLSVLVDMVAALHMEGVFRNIVTFM
ncbi:unnamed protein product [Ectocarpus sp. 12 AP-2014]